MDAPELKYALDAIAREPQPSRYSPSSVARLARSRRRRHVMATGVVTLCLLAGAGALVLEASNSPNVGIAAPAQSASGASNSAAPDAQALIGHWVLVELAGAPVAEGVDNNGGAIGLRIRAKLGDEALVFAANSRCNTGGGKVEVGPDGALTKGDILNTLVACKDTEYGANASVLTAADQLALSEDGSTLTLLRAGEELAVYDRTGA